MGVSNKFVIPFYKKNIIPIPPVALLGWTDNTYFDGDLYDRKLDNWDINSDWDLGKKYRTVICTRCAYFSKDPQDFISRCHNSLMEGGMLYVDWGLGDHWRFPDFKVGWVKGNEHEYAYGENNFLWSTVWDQSFGDNEEYKAFEKDIKNRGYESVKSAIDQEVPSVLSLEYINKYFDVEYDILTLREPYLQMYIMIKGKRNNGL